jgi:hypothetical protein
MDDRSLSKYMHFSVIMQFQRQILTKLIGENMFCMKAHQPSIVLPSKSRLVQLRIYTCYTKTCFFLGVTCYFSRMTYFWSIVLFRYNDFIIPPLPEGGGGYTVLPLSVQDIFCRIFSVTVDGRNLIFGHKRHIGIPYCR